MAKIFNYKISNYRIQFGIIRLMMLLLIQTTLNELGFWQLRVAQQQQAFFANKELFHFRNMNLIDAEKSENLDLFPSVAIFGSVVSSDLILVPDFSNFHSDKVNNYYIYQILMHEDSKKYYLVNRGKVDSVSDREIFEIESLTHSVTLKGRLFRPDWKTESPGNPKVVNSTAFLLKDIDINYLNNKYGIKLEPLELRLLGSEQGALESEFEWFKISSEFRLNLAVFFFAMAFSSLLFAIYRSVSKIE